MKTLPAPPPITMKEMEITQRKLKRGKGLGPDQIPNEAIIEANKGTLEAYRKYLSHVMTESDIAPNWQNGEIITFYTGKGRKRYNSQQQTGQVPGENNK